jgi:hypothetical protein
VVNFSRACAGLHNEVPGNGIIGNSPAPVPLDGGIPMLFSLEGVKIVAFAYVLVFLCDRYASVSEQLPVLLGP